MKTLKEYFGRDSAYWGERGNWLVAIHQTRDSDCLTRSNFRSLAKLLNSPVEKLAESEKRGTTKLTELVAIEEANHWACGWLQYLVIDPTATELIATAEKQLEQLDDYPVLDEGNFSELETEEANEVWKNCYRESDRIEYIRQHRSQFEFRGLGDMLDCVRGKYFAGYASELIS